MTGPGHSPVHYEKRDVEPGAIVRFGAILAVVTLLTSLLLWPVFNWLRGREASQDPPAPPMGRQAPGRLPPEPRLQVSPSQDLQATQREAQRSLQTYGWVDEDKGIVRIPIDEAMRLLVERSPSAPAGPQGFGPPPSPSSPPSAPPAGPAQGRIP
jgi:hypothetical protein